MAKVPPEKQAGDVIKASEFNQLSDAARSIYGLGAGRGLRVVAGEHGATIVNADHIFEFPAVGTPMPMYNASDVLVHQFRAMQMSTLANEGVEQFIGDPIIQAVKPDGSAGARMVVTAQEAAKGYAVSMYLEGIVPCTIVRAAGVTGSYGSLTSGQNYLTAGSSGQARILWEQSVADPTVEHWALVEFGQARTARVVEVQLHIHCVMTGGNQHVMRAPFGMPYGAPVPAGRLVGISMAAWVPYGTVTNNAGFYLRPKYTLFASAPPGPTGSPDGVFGSYLSFATDPANDWHYKNWSLGYEVPDGAKLGCNIIPIPAGVRDAQGWVCTDPCEANVTLYVATNGLD